MKKAFFFLISILLLGNEVFCSSVDRINQLIEDCYSGSKINIEEILELQNTISKEDIKVECIEDDTIAECTITNTSKVDAKRVYINYYVYDDKGKCLYQVDEVVSIKAGQSKYTDLDMINGYDHTEIEITDVN